MIDHFITRREPSLYAWHAVEELGHDSSASSDMTKIGKHSAETKTRAQVEQKEADGDRATGHYGVERN